MYTWKFEFITDEKESCFCWNDISVPWKKGIGLYHIYTGVFLETTAVSRYAAEMFSILLHWILKGNILKVENLKISTFYYFITETHP